MGQAAVADEIDETVGEQVEFRWNQMHFGAGGKSAIKVVGRKIEVQRRMARDPIALFEAEVTVRPFYERNDIGVGDNHALWHARSSLK